MMTPFIIGRTSTNTVTVQLPAARVGNFFAPDSSRKDWGGVGSERSRRLGDAVGRRTINCQKSPTIRSRFPICLVAK